MVAEAHCEMADSHYVASLRAAFSAWMELQREWAGECYLSMKSSRLRTTKPTPPDTNLSRTEQSVKLRISVGDWRQALEAKGLSTWMATFSYRLGAGYFVVGSVVPLEMAGCWQNWCIGGKMCGLIKNKSWKLRESIISRRSLHGVKMVRRLSLAGRWWVHTSAFLRDVFWKHVQILGICASAMTALTGLELSRSVMAVAPLLYSLTYSGGDGWQSCYPDRGCVLIQASHYRNIDLTTIKCVPCLCRASQCS